jgi:TetR/AcrR family transcriptional regulator, lmrAB and yxaGH operons repressor
VLKNLDRPVYISQHQGRMSKVCYTQSVSAAAVRTAAVPVDTRSRILAAAFRLFRKHGYNGVGLKEILTEAQAPKGSLYHHFPDGKEQIGVAVVGQVTAGIIGLLDHSTAPSTADALLDMGKHMAATIERTNHEICSLFTGFLAERNSSPRLGAAVAESYRALTETLCVRLRAEGVPAKQALERATAVVILLEGGATVAQAQLDVAPFRLAVKHAAALCRV